MEKRKDVKITEHKDGPNGLKYFTYEEVEKEPIKMDVVDVSKDLSVVTYINKNGFKKHQIQLKAEVYGVMLEFLNKEMADILNADRSIRRSTEDIIFFSLLLGVSSSLSTSRLYMCGDGSSSTFNLTHSEMAALNRFCQIWQLRLKPEEEGSFEHQCLIAMNTILAPLVTMY